MLGPGALASACTPSPSPSSSHSAFKLAHRSAETGAYDINSENVVEGTAYQGSVVRDLAEEIEAQDSRKADVIFYATTLLRGTTDDSGGGFAVVKYNNSTRKFTYELNHRTFTSGSISFEISSGLLNTSYSGRVCPSETTCSTQ